AAARPPWRPSLRQNILQSLQDRLAPVRGQVDAVEDVVGDHRLLVLEYDHGQLGVPGDTIPQRSLGLLPADAEHNGLDPLLDDQSVEPLFQPGVVAAEDDVDAGLLTALAGEGVPFELPVDGLDQTDQGVADLAREDQSDQAVAGHSDRAALLAGVL